MPALRLADFDPGFVGGKQVNRGARNAAAREIIDAGLHQSAPDSVAAEVRLHGEVIKKRTSPIVAAEYGAHDVVFPDRDPTEAGVARQERREGARRVGKAEAQSGRFTPKLQGDGDISGDERTERKGERPRITVSAPQRTRGPAAD